MTNPRLKRDTDGTQNNVNQEGRGKVRGRAELRGGDLQMSRDKGEARGAPGEAHFMDSSTFFNFVP